MNKLLYTLLVVVVAFLSLFLYGLLFVQPARMRLLENELSDRLDQELQGFYPDKTPSKGLYIRRPYLSEYGLTSSFGVTVVLTDCKYTSVEKAEKKFAEVYANYQKKLHSIRFMRPFLSEYPMTSDFIQLAVSFKEIDGRWVSPPYMMSVSIEPDDILSFDINTPETLEQWTQIFAKPLQSSKYLQPYLNPSVERTMAEEVSVPVLNIDTIPSPMLKSIASSFMVPFADRYHIFPLTVSSVNEDFFDYAPFSFALWGKEKMEFDQAHLMAARCAKEFFEFVEKDKDSLKFMKKMMESPKVYHETTIIPEIRHIAFRIFLWDEWINRREAPYIAEIRFNKGKFKYFTSDEGQRLVLVYEESFDDAMKFLDRTCPYVQ